MKLKIALFRCTKCYGRALAVIDAEGEQTCITEPKCHNSWRLVNTFDADIPDEFLVGAECPVHHFAEHGKEAEELRQGIERILKDGKACDGCDCAADYLEALQGLLDKVDASDSLAYLERGVSGT